MTDPLSVTVVGGSGRMGRMLIQAVLENPATTLTGVTERAGHDWVGQDAGTAMGAAPTGVRVEADPLDAIARSRIVLDFTAPAATVEHAALAAQAHAVHVIGTTGLEPPHLQALEAAARHTTIVRAGNFSLGVNLLTVLTERVAASLGPEFDVEILETHHRHKVDAPSGTALMFGEAAAAGRGIALDGNRESGRDGITGARADGAIGFSAIRGGDVVGEHDVVFAGAGERVVLRHIASDRMLFARGAVTAAIWGAKQKPGEYDMIDVLGLR
ncbi:MAG: 4-hydroxy-tetrahydrodipicolinate reductase [Pseudomonadota bacterium]